MAELSSLQAITLATFDPATLTGSYQIMNGVGTSDDCKILKIYNGSATVGIIISLDGVTDHDFWPPGATIIIDSQTNHQNEQNASGTLYVRKGQLIYGKTAASNTIVYISGFR